MKKRFNTLTLLNAKKLAHKYRKTPLLNKGIFWAAFILLPTLFMLSQGTTNLTPVFMAVSTIAVSIHILISYTQYLLIILPNLVHFVVMPFTLGYYWVLGQAETIVITDLNIVYSWGALIGVISTPLFIWAVVKLTRGKMWLTFVLAYVSVDLLGLAWIENQPSLGLFIPLILATAVLLIRSKILHRLMKKDKYSTAPSNIFLDNKNTAKELTQDLLSSSEDIVIPLEAQDFFDHLIINKNRVFAVYSLDLEKSIKVSADENNDIQLRYRGEIITTEMGVVLHELSRLSKRFAFQKTDMTPLILCHNKTLPPDKKFLGTKVTRKGVQISSEDIFDGIVYFIHADKLPLIHSVWKKHTLSKTTQKRISSDDMKGKAKTS